MVFFKETTTRSGAIGGLIFYFLLCSFTLGSCYPLLLLVLIKGQLSDLLSHPLAVLMLLWLIMGGYFYYCIFRDYSVCLKRIDARERRQKKTSINRL